MDTYRRAIDYLKNYKTNPMHMKGFQLIVNDLIMKEDHETLISIYQEAIRLYPDIRIFHFNLASFLYQQSSRLKESAERNFYEEELHSESGISAEEIRRIAELRQEAASAYEKYLDLSRNLPEVQVTKIKEKINKLRDSGFN